MVFRIHAELFAKAGRPRRQEWDMALRDLNHSDVQDPRTLTLYEGKPDGLLLALSAAEGDMHIVELSGEQLSEHFRAYDDIIRRIASAASGEGDLRNIETLDYAKKLIHDEAGELVQEALEAQVTLDLSVARRLFTLMFLIGTQLPEKLVTFHRAHR